MLSKVRTFLQTDIWRIPSKKLPRKQLFLIKHLRVIVLAVREFYGNKCQLSASALTFYSLLSIVPVAAMAFGIAKGFGFEKILEKQLLEKFPGQETTLMQVISFANNLLEDTKGGLIAGIGVIMLFWTVVKVLNSIEESFNEIWGVKRGRTFGRKISDYLSMMLICPFLIIASSGLTVFIRTQITVIAGKLSAIGSLSHAVFFLLNLLPFVMVWVLFTFIYIFMPNTKVTWKSGLLGGIIAGTIYQIVQCIYITFQVGVANTNAIYGSFAALPLFLIWMQLSWRIVLFGTEIAFAHQNVDTYEFEHDCLNVSYSFKRLLSLQITAVLAKHFAAGQKPLTASQISDSLEIPIRLVSDLLFELVETGIVAEIRERDLRQISYQPARDINALTIQYVADALDNKGTSDIPVAQTEELRKLTESFGSFSELIRKSPSNKLLKDL